ncbi:MAG: hypothetical protein RLZZ292_843 [Bacteroidota bacterium]
MNAACSLNALGFPTYMISRVGKDLLGDEILNFLEAKNCPTTYIQHDKKHATGVVQVTSNTAGENSYEIVQPSSWDFIGYNKKTQAKIDEAQAIIFGTLVARTPVSAKTLLNLLNTATLKVFDVNFRAPFYTQVLVEQLLQKANIVKMNDEELDIIASWHGFDTSDEAILLQTLKEKYALQSIIVTKGANGAMGLDENNHFHTCKGFKVVVKNTVGSGDAFLAGFLKQYLGGEKMDNALRFACAMGAFVATQEGANPVFEEATINEILRPLPSPPQREGSAVE